MNSVSAPDAETTRPSAPSDGVSDVERPLASPVELTLLDGEPISGAWKSTLVALMDEQWLSQCQEMNRLRFMYGPGFRVEWSDVET